MTALELYKKLFAPFPDEVKSEQSMGGKGKITFVEWYHYIARAWQEFPEGFTTEIRNTYAVGHGADTAQLIMVIRVTDKATGLYHEGSGSAPLTKPKKNFGGCNAEAEAQALKRAFAKFGLGLEMYMDEEDKAQADPDAEQPTKPTSAQLDRIKQLIALAPEDNEKLQDMIAQSREDVKKATDKQFRAELTIEMLESELAALGVEVPDPS